MSRDDMAVDQDGNPLPYAPHEVEQIVRDAIDSGEIMVAIMRKDGNLMVQVFGPPSYELLDILEQATRGYRRVLQGH